MNTYTFILLIAPTMYVNFGVSKAPTIIYKSNQVIFRILNFK